MIALLIKTSLIVVIVLGFYKILIEKESFFSTNRLYLILGLLLTFTIPFVSLPKLVENQGLVSELIEPTLEIQNTDSKKVEALISSDNLIEKPSESVANTPIKETTTATKSSRSLLDWLFIAYIFGVVVLSLNLLAQVANLVIKILRSKDKIKDEDGIIINASSIKEPCSFFNYIFINPERYEFDIYEQIIAHEKIHVKKRHSLDLLLSEIAVILLWFNPFIWLFRKEVEKNIEYQTDHLLIDTDTTEKDSYQLNLLKIATYNQPLTITTNYNQSLIKQRILKMNTKKSNPHSYWKYAFTFPMFFALLLLLNKPYTAFAQPEDPILGDDIITTIDTPEPEYFSDCEAFKEALEAKNVAKLKEILINLDPACIEYIENTEHETLTSVKNKLQEGAGLEVDTTGNLVVTNSNGTTTETINTAAISESIVRSNSECKTLLQAIGIQDIQKVKMLLASIEANCIDPNPGYNVDMSSGTYMRYQKPKSPLFAAARYGYIEIAKLLVENGADVKMTVRGDGTALITAAEYGHLDIVRYLVSKGADINRTFPNQGNALIAASGNGHLNVMEYLVNKGVDVNYYSPNQGNALIAAAHSNNTDAVKYLVDKGMDIHFISPNQGNALIVASGNGQLETVKYLISKGAKINEISPNQGTPLISAASNGHTITVKYLVTKGAKINKVSPNQGTPLISAASNGHTKTVDYLVTKGAEIDKITSNQGNALIIASNNGFLETVKFLVAKGADVNVQTRNQGSAVNAAARNGHKEIMKYLIDNGAEINHSSDSHGSPLISAATNGASESVAYLLEKGADINTQTNGQGSALNAAARNGINSTIELLLSKGADINAQTNGQGSALNAAARNGHLHTVKLLLSKGADINLQNNGQGSALNAAARNGYNNVIELLLAKGADVNLQNNGQGSALNAAARNGLLSTVKLLVENGADVNLYSNGQGTALAAASKNNYKAVVDYLLSKGAKHIYGN